MKITDEYLIGKKYVSYDSIEGGSVLNHWEGVREYVRRYPGDVIVKLITSDYLCEKGPHWLLRIEKKTMPFRYVRASISTVGDLNAILKTCLVKDGQDS